VIIELIKVKGKTNYNVGQYLILEIYYLSKNQYGYKIINLENAPGNAGVLIVLN